MTQPTIFSELPRPQEPLLAARGITRRFPGVLALDGVDLELRRGQALGVVGENGAGKSTLMKILSGALAPDAGQLLLDGKPVAFANVRQAKRRGIALIHQELMLAPNLDVTANIFLGNEPRGLGLLTPLRRRGMRRAAQQWLGRVGLDVGPGLRVGTLSTGQMQRVEIARALALEARVLILDEPTSALTTSEAQRLFGILDELLRRGLGLIYISHKLEEVLRLADRIMVLRDGRRVGEMGRNEATQDKLVALMVGRELAAWTGRPAAPAQRPVILEVRDLKVPGTSQGVSFDLRAGEILGFAGLVGSGRSELMRTIFGLTPALGGTMSLDGAPYAPRQPRQALARGVCLAPEDRKRHGLILLMSIVRNIALPSLRANRPRLWIKSGDEARRAAQQVELLHIRCRGITQKTVDLSGGNQQKVVLGKWLNLLPRVLIVDEPTRGIDVAAKVEIYRQLAALAARGVAIIWVSSELEEILKMSDRVVVMRKGRIAAVRERDAIDARDVGNLMMGS